MAKEAKDGDAPMKLFGNTPDACFDGAVKS